MAIVAEPVNENSPALSNLRQNDSSLIFRLPPETLVHIFTLGAREYHESADHRFIGFRVPDWVKVSYVCYHWRNVALDCAALWTYHFTVSLRWTEELLARSKQASLKIRIHFNRSRPVSWWSVLLDELLSHLDRIQELCLRIPPDMPFPSENFSLHAPRLQILDISRHCGGSSNWHSTVDDGDTLPLCVVKLAKFSLPWQSLCLSGVTTLFLQGDSHPFQLDTGEFLATLTRMPALTLLHLKRALSSAHSFLSSTSFQVTPKIDLPHLARLFVIAPLSAVVALLSCTNIPSKTKLRLQFEWENGSSAVDYAPISSFLAQRFGLPKELSPFSSTIRSLGICFLPSQSIFALCVSVDDDCDAYTSMEYPNCDPDLPLMIFVAIGPLMTNVVGDHIIIDICHSIPIRDVRSLCVSNPTLSLDLWRKVLGYLCELRFIVLRDGYMPDLTSLLRLTADELERTRSGDLTSDCNRTVRHVFVPELEELNLYGIRFPSVGVSEITLLDALATRKVLRPRLIVFGCTTALSPWWS